MCRMAPYLAERRLRTAGTARLGSTERIRAARAGLLVLQTVVGLSNQDEVNVVRLENLKRLTVMRVTPVDCLFPLTTATCSASVVCEEAGEH